MFDLFLTYSRIILSLIGYLFCQVAGAKEPSAWSGSRSSIGSAGYTKKKRASLYAWIVLQALPEVCSVH